MSTVLRLHNVRVHHTVFAHVCECVGLSSTNYDRQEAEKKTYIWYIGLIDTKYDTKGLEFGRGLLDVLVKPLIPGIWDPYEALQAKGGQGGTSKGSRP
jgi:hypothetical protein